MAKDRAENVCQHQPARCFESYSEDKEQSLHLTAMDSLKSVLMTWVTSSYSLPSHHSEMMPPSPGTIFFAPLGPQLHDVTINIMMRIASTYHGNMCLALC